VDIQIEDKMFGDRLRSSIRYGEGLGSDTYEWQLYTLDVLTETGEDIGLSLVLACTDFDEDKPYTYEKPMMQLVFEKG